MRNAIALIAFGLALSGCGSKDDAAPVVTPAPVPTSDRNVPLSSYGRAKISVGGHEIDVYVADERAERADGLMFVKQGELGDNEGMVFVFGSEEPLRFWMENTLIPLDIAYLDSAGKIINILQMQPLDPSPRPSAGPAKYAVEMHEGWFLANGVDAGDKFDLSGILQ